MSYKIDSLTEKNDQDHMRFRITFSITLLICTALIAYGIANLFLGKYYPGIVELSFGIIILTINLIFLLVKKEYILPSFLVNVITLIMALYLYWSGGFHRTGIFWCLAFPGLFISTRGIKLGFIWILAQISSLGLIYFLSTFDILKVAYDGTETMAALFVYLFTCYIHFSYEISRSRNKKEINLLQGLLPICSYCKKIRDKEGKWEPVDSYLNTKRDIDFSHSICPDCLKIHYPDYIKETEE